MIHAFQNSPKIKSQTILKEAFSFACFYISDYYFWQYIIATLLWTEENLKTHCCEFSNNGELVMKCWDITAQRKTLPGGIRNSSY